MDITAFLDKVNAAIINPLLILLFAIAFLVFFVGIFQFIRNSGEASERDVGKRKIVFGLIGMFIMFSAYGLIHFVLNTFHIEHPAYLQGK